MRRCIELVLATAGGELAEPPLDLWPAPIHPPRIFLRPARVAQVLGVELPWHELERYLVAIGATVVSKPEDGRIAVDVPGWRPDLQREIDLIEEIARLHGYDSFPAELRPFRLGTLPDAPDEAVGRGLGRGLAAEGFYEVVSLPIGAGRRRRQRAAAQSARRGRGLAPPPRCCPAWCGWSRPTGPTTCRTCGCSRSAPSSPRAGPASARGRSAGVAAVLTGRREPAHWTGTGEARFDSGISRAGSRPRSLWRFPEAVVQVEGQALGRPGPRGPSGRPGRPAGRRRAALGGAALRVRAARRSGAPPSRSLRAAAHDPVVRARARAAPARGGARAAGGERAPAGRRRAARAGGRRERLPRRRSCRPAPGAWPSGSPSARRTGPCATAK